MPGGSGNNTEWLDRCKRLGVCVLTGPFYPSPIEGDNPTKVSRAHFSDAERWYHDDAIRLSEQFLNASNGCDGIPVCVNHNKSDVVGHVNRSWMGSDGNVWGQMVVPLDERGRQIQEEVRAGKWKSFSISYGVRFSDPDEQRVVASKNLKEVSLVPEPFFPGMDIMHMVECSSGKQRKKCSRKMFLTNFIHFEKKTTNR